MRADQYLTLNYVIIDDSVAVYCRGNGDISNKFWALINELSKHDLVDHSWNDMPWAGFTVSVSLWDAVKALIPTAPYIYITNVTEKD